MEVKSSTRDIESAGMNYPKFIGTFCQVLIFTFIIAADIKKNYAALGDFNY